MKKIPIGIILSNLALLIPAFLNQINLSELFLVYWVELLFIGTINSFGINLFGKTKYIFLKFFSFLISLSIFITVLYFLLGVLSWAEISIVLSFKEIMKPEVIIPLLILLIQHIYLFSKKEESKDYTIKWSLWYAEEKIFSLSILCMLSVPISMLFKETSVIIVLVFKIIIDLFIRNKISIDKFLRKF